jgi:2-haloacid dehalogenase
VIRAAVFDAYGTLFDVGSAARRLAGTPGNEALASKWRGLAADWRRKQLEYSWLRAAAGAHADFWQVTGDALDWALDAAGLAEAGLRDDLMALYRELAVYPEVPEVLARLRSGGLRTGILSNGSPSMLDAAVASAGIAGLLDHVLSVEAVGVFKPAPSVYDLVGAAFRVAPQEVLFVSSNGWDAAAASGRGFATIWANREGAPPERLPWAPHWQLPDLRGVPELAGIA